MALSEQDDMDASRLTDSDKAILDELKKDRGTGRPWGMATKGYLVDGIDFSRNTIYNRLGILEGHGHVRLVHEPTRLYAFVDDPREETESEHDKDHQNS